MVNNTTSKINYNKSFKTILAYRILIQQHNQLSYNERNLAVQWQWMASGYKNILGLIFLLRKLNHIILITTAADLSV